MLGEVSPMIKAAQPRASRAFCGIDRSKLAELYAVAADQSSAW